jgi:threonylcarbamoyladenosine tRNA methylthiotransferase MtaB
VKYSVVTFGCRVNQADSLSIEAELSRRGAECTTSDRADLVVVNTCSVTASADQGARQTIRRIARENPHARIVATGCYATRCADEVASLPGVSDVIPNGAKEARTFVARLVDGDAAVLEGACGRLRGPGLMGRTAWTLRVQTGCEEACSYCIIPTTRGASRSRTFADISHELTEALGAGYKEIAITGVHLGSYGRDLSRPSSLVALLDDLLALASAEAGDGRVLFRISSLEPMDCPRTLASLAAAGTASAEEATGASIAPHFHLPLQHASDRLLRAMRRPYSLAYFRDLVDGIRARLPHAAIGSDVIVGFPGETERDFVELAEYLAGSPLTQLHVFPYSDRPGTVASALPEKVHGRAIKERAQALRDVSRALASRFRESLKGVVRPALTIEDGSVAVTDNYVRVAAPPGHARNEWVAVEL